MPRLPTVTARKLIQILKKKGFMLDTTEGSHQLFRHPTKNLRAVVPYHAGKDLGRGITLAILKDAGIPREEFARLDELLRSKQRSIRETI